MSFFTFQGDKPKSACFFITIPKPIFFYLLTQQAFCSTLPPKFYSCFEEPPRFSPPLHIPEIFYRTLSFMRTVGLFLFQNQTEPFLLYFLSPFSFLSAALTILMNLPIFWLTAIAFIAMPDVHNTLDDCA